MQPNAKTYYTAYVTDTKCQDSLDRGREATEVSYKIILSCDTYSRIQ